MTGLGHQLLTLLHVSLLYHAATSAHNITSIAASPTQPVEDAAATFTVNIAIDSDPGSDVLLDAYVWNGKGTEPADAAAWTALTTKCTATYTTSTPLTTSCDVNITYTAGDSTNSPYTPKAQLFTSGDVTTLLLSPAFSMTAVTVRCIQFKPMLRLCQSKIQFAFFSQVFKSANQQHVINKDYSNVHFALHAGGCCNYRSSCNH